MAGTGNAQMGDGFAVDPRDLGTEVEEVGDDGGEQVSTNDRDPGGTDSEAARDLVRLSDQPRGQDGKFGQKDPRQPAKNPERVDTDLDVIRSELRAIREQDTKAALEAEGGDPKKTAKAKALDGKTEKGKDSGVAKDPAGKQADENTGDDATETARSKPTRKAIADAYKVLELDKWKPDEIAALTDDALILAASKAKERQTEVSRKLQEAAKGAKAAPDAAAKKAGTTEAKAVAKQAADDGDADDDEALTQMASEAFSGFDDPDGKFTAAVADHSKRVTAHVRSMIESGLEEVQKHLGEQFKSVLKDVVEEFNFKTGLQSIRSKYAAHLKDKASLDSLRATTRALREQHPSYEDALEAAARSLWAGDAVAREAERQRKATAARANGTADLTSRGASTAPQNDLDIIRGELRKLRNT